MKILIYVILGLDLLYIVVMYRHGRRRGGLHGALHRIQPHRRQRHRRRNE